MNPSVVKAPLFAVCLIPFGLLFDAFRDVATGVEASESLTRELGTWTFNFLLLTLCVTPLRRYTGWNWLARLRRTLGLFTFFYAVLHLTSYLWLKQEFAWGEIAGDLLERHFIAAGLVGFLLMAALAATSNAFALRQLGGRRWQELHRSIYAIALLALLHCAWMVESGIAKPLAYATIVALLLGLRARWRVQERKRQLAGADRQNPPRQERKVIPIVVKK